MKYIRIKPGVFCRYGNMVVIIAVALYFFIISFFNIVSLINDKNLKSESMPRFALNIHRSITPKFEKWAKKRVDVKKAEKLSINNISGTEWPIFGSAFYLWATESLQDAWEKDTTILAEAPKNYAKGAIEAAAALIADPAHASWVKKHWGNDYLHKENAFYRMLLIGGLTSYHKLLGGDKYLPIIRDQVETLSKELDESPYGLLNDYPEQCYPGDVLASIAMIKRADKILGTDHSDFVKRAIRGFQGKCTDSIIGLPPYAASIEHEPIMGISRGCANSYMLIFAPELWETTAQEWYRIYEKHFWQKRWTAVSFREFPKDTLYLDWYFDVDAGPVLAGHGVSAGAFGIGAARANGRFDHAFPLSTEVITASWPLPNGTLLGPRLLSDMTDAPYLGEAALLFVFTRTPPENYEVISEGTIPLFVYIYLSLYLFVGILLITLSVILIRRWHKKTTGLSYKYEKIQMILWMILICIGFSFLAINKFVIGIIMLILAQIIPRGRVKSINKEE